MVVYEINYRNYDKREKIMEFLESWADMLNGEYKIIDGDKAEITVDDRLSSRERKNFEKGIPSFSDRGLAIKVISDSKQ